MEYNAIGDNTAENREHLEGIGYKPNSIEEESKFIFTYMNLLNIPTYIDEYKRYLIGDLGNFRDCRGNPSLFQAVTAIRDDNDYMQWFTNGKEWILCDRDDFVDMHSTLCCGGHYNYNKNGELDEFHKATLEELIKYLQ